MLAPELETFRAWALTSSNLPALRLLSDERSALPHLPRVTTPVFMMQGRRDFAFGIDQATRAYSTLAGPKALWIGNHGHAPSRFPAVDTAAMMAAGKTWFDRYLRGLPVDTGPPVRVAREGMSDAVGFSRLPATKTVRLALPGTEDDRAGDEARSHGKANGLEDGGLRPTRREGDGHSRWRLGTPRGRVDGAYAGRQRDHRLLRRPAHDTRQADVHDSHDRPGDVRAQGLPLLGDRRIVLVGAEPREPSYLDLPMVAGARVTLGPMALSIPVLTKVISG